MDHTLHTYYIVNVVVDVSLNLNALPHKQQLLKDCAMNVIPLCSRFLFIEWTNSDGTADQNHFSRTEAFARGRKRLRVSFIHMLRYHKMKKNLEGIQT